MKKLILVLTLAVLSSTCFSAGKPLCTKVIDGSCYFPGETVSREVLNDEGFYELATFEVLPDGSERRIDLSKHRNTIDPSANKIISMRKFGEDGFEIELADGGKERYCVTKDGRLYKDDVGLSTCVR